MDIYSDGELIFSDLAYKDMSDYLVVFPQTYRIEVFPAGEKLVPVLDTELIVNPSERLTIPIIGILPEVSLLPLPENFQGWGPSDSIVRFAHLSPNTPRVDVTLPDGLNWFSNVGYTEATDYRLIVPGSYDLQMRPIGEEDIVLAADTFMFNRGNSYTVYAVGLLGEEPPLEMIYYEDQIAFLAPEPEKYEDQTAFLAPEPEKAERVVPKKRNYNTPNNIKINFKYKK